MPGHLQNRTLATRFAGQLLPFLSHCGYYMHVVQLLSQYRSLLNILMSLSGMPLLGGYVATYEQRLHKIDATSRLARGIVAGQHPGVLKRFGLADQAGVAR
jgi:hypothetical protein